MSRLSFYCAIIWSFPSRDIMQILAYFSNYKHIPGKNLVKDVIDKGNVLVLLNLQK